MENNIEEKLEQIYFTITEKIAQVPIPYIMLGAALMLLFVVVLLVLFYFIGRKIGKLEIMQKQSELLKSERADAVKRSRSVLGGQLCEQIAPFLPNFPCRPDDARFIGKPVDFIGFVGLSESFEEENIPMGKSEKDLGNPKEKERGFEKEIDEILFIEVKTGTSKLSPREKAIKKAIEQKKVRYVEYRFD